MICRSKRLLALLSAAVLLLAGCQSNKTESSASKTQQQEARPAENDTLESPQFTVRDLIQAARKGRKARVQTAVTEGGLDANASDQRGNTPLMLAAYNGHTDVVTFLLSEGAQIDARNGQARTALMFAATGPFPETVSLLLERGADPNAVDKAEGWSPLMFAAAEGNQKVVELLLEQGADPSLKDQDGETAQTFAENRNHTAVVSLLNKHE